MEPVPLSHEDRAILDIEGPHIVGHTCKVIVLASPTPSLEALRDEISSRLDNAPLLSRRLGEGSAGPVWLQDHEVDIQKHVFESATVGGEVEFRQQVAALFAQHLDRSRPLWRLDTVRLPGGALGLVWRIHHALADGVTAMRLADAVLWDRAPAAPEQVRPAAPQSSSAAAQDEDRRRGHLAGFLRREFAESLRQSPFDGDIGSRRSVAFAAAPLQGLHDSARHLAGATVNEAVLCVVAGGLRRWLLERHRALDSVRLRVPVSLHHQGDDAGNRDSFFTLPVSLHEADPVARLKQIHAESAERKQEHDAERLESLLDSAGAVSPSLRALLERLDSGPRSFALAVSNVPGPSAPVSVVGAPVVSLHSLAEVGKRHGLRVSVVSLAGSLAFGVTADPGIAPQVDDLAAGIEAESAALSRATV
jgi:hypothetical protein